MPFSIKKFNNNLYFRSVSPEFLNNCVNIITDCSDAPKVLNAQEHFWLMTYQEQSNVKKILIGNDSFFYEIPTIDIGRPIAKIDIKTPFPGVPVRFDKSKFTVRIPDKGMVIVPSDKAIGLSHGTPNNAFTGLHLAQNTLPDSYPKHRSVF